MPLLSEDFGRFISEAFDNTLCSASFSGLDSGADAFVFNCSMDLKFPVFTAGIKPWTGGGIKTRNGGLEDSGDNRKLLGEGSRKAKGWCP